MKRLTICVLLLLLAGFTAAMVAAERAYATNDSSKPAEARQSTVPEPATSQGSFERGGTDIGRGYSYAGNKLAQGSASFGKNLVEREFGEAGRSFGYGAGEFGKGVGIGTARGFKNFGLGFRDLGKKIDRSLTGD
jgi:hypothetical protein